jgi:hypothetical protein
MQPDLSPSKNLYRLDLYFLAICLLLMVVSCDCKNSPVHQKNKKDSTEEINPTRPHLLMSSDKSNLENEQVNFIVFIKNEGATMANLHDYHWKINLQEEGGDR